MRAPLLTLSAMLLAGTAPASAAEMFNRVATFPVVRNLPEGADIEKKTIAEIISATEDGNLLAYTDSERGALGLVDIIDPAQPKPAGFVQLEGEPTSVKIVGGRAYVAVNTSESYTSPDGHLAVVDLATKAVVAKCELGGQPDSIASSPDKAFLAIVIENERDEELNDGAIPQLPTGNLTIVRLKDGEPDCAGKQIVDLTGIAAIGPDDAEPEFVDINNRNEAIVSLQENNHIAIVDLATAKISAHFPAGTVSLEQIDTEKDGVIRLTGSMKDVPREPDSVHWIDDNRFVTANEGDWKGGSRGFTIFNRDGTIDYESGASFEHEVVRIGHYPENRNKKGIEPEGIEVDTFGQDRLIFVGSERASVVGVYRDAGAKAAPELLQILPGGIGPEGLLAIPGRNLFVTASENDAREKGGAGSQVTIYARTDGPALYPTLKSADKNGLPIAWGAISGTAADPVEPGKLYAVTDSFYSEAQILTIDASKTPALITDALTVTQDGKPAKGLDLEGIAVRAEGGFWLASEGNPEKKEKATQSQLVRVDEAGAIQEIIELPEELKAQATRFGFEGVAVTGSGDNQRIWLAVQREWKDDPKGFTKILSYQPATKAWSAVHYPLDKAEKGWIGLSELTAAGDGWIVIERDNQIGDAARVKKLMKTSLDGIEPAPIGSKEIPVLKKTELLDLLPDLEKPHGTVIEKVESFAVDAAGAAFIITDNDGVDGSSGETQLIRLGKFGAE
ncbi:esterase-like activity of phytase family protein [Terrihabitans sp. B22-R8]|uniref:esterase-like activity of phytase family protein n=1 Tax=Terrihabitans sp. B22-R8 TaxID=3425128 RepID=UPI00403D5265